MKKYQVIGGHCCNAYYYSFCGESDTLRGAMQIAKRAAKYSVNTPEIYRDHQVNPENHLPIQNAQYAAFWNGYEWVKHWEEM